MIAKDTDRENKTKTKKVNLRVPCVVDVEKNGDIFIRVVFRDTGRISVGIDRSPALKPFEERIRNQRHTDLLVTCPDIDTIPIIGHVNPGEQSVFVSRDGR